jgi:hypothetical protein
MAERARATSRRTAPETQIEEILALLEDLRAEVHSFLILGRISQGNLEKLGRCDTAAGFARLAKCPPPGAPHFDDIPYADEPDPVAYRSLEHAASLRCEGSA